MSPDFDPVYRADCPSRVILDQIADKWSMLVLAVLSQPRRFNAIKRRLEGITQRVLTQTLRKLERNGMVTRTVIAGPVLGVEYALTPLGRSLQTPFADLYKWTVGNMDEIQRCQRSFDENRQI
jgi:DNA-binding HxlR family transcriptional regulator